MSLITPLVDRYTYWNTKADREIDNLTNRFLFKSLASRTIQSLFQHWFSACTSTTFASPLETLDVKAEKFCQALELILAPSFVVFKEHAQKELTRKIQDVRSKRLPTPSSLPCDWKDLGSIYIKF